MTSQAEQATDARTLDFALALWGLGLSVVPVPRPVPGTPKGTPGDGKVPAIRWKDYQERRPNERELRAWFTTDQNLAVVTGAVSGVVAVDADDDAAVRWVRRNMLRTPWRVRTARGLHLYYRHPGVPVRNRARIETRAGALALDIRGDGGFVVAPGSVHASGAVYTAEGDWSVPAKDLPAFWVGLLERPKHDPPRSGPRRTRDVQERARRYLVAIPPPVIGQGSDNVTLYAACRLVRGFGLAESEAVALLWEWAGGRPGWTREWVQSKVHNASRYGEEPIGGLR